MIPAPADAHPDPDGGSAYCGVEMINPPPLGSLHPPIPQAMPFRELTLIQTES